ncbi:MAG: Methyl-viologen-reducing hydrogenase, delta subunit [Candidatus Methanoperedenaceae archaeon GB37]|nr:Methyl-viologen-reducing hydrogenase, delta subunit [Candidatus Methanoperedenaceae archaeon GB37]CAD7782649.1 MAG: Methyl-viologen-reducing hydrogenase, delta subunit [Candidatus Methanoperedenaceae archaeon GB37]
MVVCFYCYHCGLEERDLIKTIPSGDIKTNRVACTGKIDSLMLLHALEEGAEQIFVFGCPEEECHNVTGSKKARSRIEYLKKILKELGIKEEVIKFVTMPRVISLYKMKQKFAEGEINDCR